ncbi:FAD-binding oxidoreductase [Elizabethkingia anophelis]|uniref:NAD(P)/FAD-dependent oxidoreductase n=1 Tax=Elizabethkingia anophelis TaxID=1117645 RepID=UPI000389E5C1|nr:FAD-binding oxidoreductase [Elizabethkingia anophelis]EQB92100.1 FAD-dependent oxidoreductase [Elizabethkingia anophelis 502]MCT3698775.1 FAD-binding oxidoreductase [Elizabethkingia anophelis]MCT3788095.1 FAD-binding oxidoreductase [Elizabethkingia anophelis]MCT3924157.1 FAD-binding oxidoreductase [Elizabethkingia anophelis]MCT3959259.1 FAD-binding oxidoreductase [Elizabethkingia anophelis]
MDLKSNEPFWLIKDGLIQSFPSLMEDKTCDVLIVGGGITGSLIAHQCIKDGYNTILIDKREIANGSTSATTSMLQYEIDIPLYKLSEMIGDEGAIASYKACSDSIDTIEDIVKQIHTRAGYKKKKSLYFAARKKDVQWLQKEFEARRNAGFDVKWLSADSILKQYGIEKTFGGIISAQGASIDAFMLVHKILAYNQKKGLQIYDRTELKKVKSGKTFNEVILNTEATIKAKKIIYCTGYESTNMIKENFVKLISTYAIVSEAKPEKYKKFNNLLVWNTEDPYIYLRTTDDGRILIGGEDEAFRDPEKRDSLITDKEQKLLHSFQKYLPLTEFQSDFAWAGTFGTTKDGLPYIGEHKDFLNTYFVLGFGGNGITFSVVGMEMVSSWLKEEKHKLTEWFRFHR